MVGYFAGLILYQLGERLDKNVAVFEQNCYKTYRTGVYNCTGVCAHARGVKLFVGLVS